MKINFKKTYKFAIKSALYISLFATGFVLILMNLFYKNQLKYQVGFGIIFLFSVYIFSFLVLQYRVERFIYRRVKKIYDEVSLLQSTTLINQPITTDMETLSREVKKCNGAGGACQPLRCASARRREPTFLAVFPQNSPEPRC